MTIFKISIHALREEGDLKLAALMLVPCYFYPRPPRGGRHPAKVAGSIGKEFLSTPSARRATWVIKEVNENDGISIHALREEGDAATIQNEVIEAVFLSTPSARRATGASCGAWKAESQFLSTPSARRATT